MSYKPKFINFRKPVLAGIRAGLESFPAFTGIENMPERRDPDSDIKNIAKDIQRINKARVSIYGKLAGQKEKK